MRKKQLVNRRNAPASGNDKPDAGAFLFGYLQKPFCSSPSFCSPFQGRQPRLHLAGALLAFGNLSHEGGGVDALTPVIIRHSGLDGLFASTDPSASSPAPANRTSSVGGHFTRKVEIFEPKNFEEAVNIVTMLKEGSVVILNLKYVNAGLSKRILDFAFGAVAALDMQITYEAPQVFSIIKDGKLTLVERDQLRLKKVL